MKEVNGVEYKSKIMFAKIISNSQNFGINISGMDIDMSEKNIHNIFSEYGFIVDLFRVLDKDYRKTDNVVIFYDNDDSARNALSFDGLNKSGNKIRVRLCTQDANKQKPYSKNIDKNKNSKNRKSRKDDNDEGCILYLYYSLYSLQRKKNRSNCLSL